MTIGIVAEVRDLTGIFDTNDLPDSRIQAAINYGKGELYSVTFKTDWDTDTSHPLFKKAETLVHYFASFHILDRYSGNFEKANTHRERAKELAAELKMQYDQYSLIHDAASGSSTARFSVVASSYKSFPLNPDAEITKSKVIIPGD
jgi:hypothetical protein